MKFANARVYVFSDAPAHTPAECPYGFDVELELKRLSEAGAQVLLIDCGGTGQAFDGDAFTRAGKDLLGRHKW